MPQFRYKAKDRNGKTIERLGHSSSRGSMLMELEKKGLVVVSIDEVRVEKKTKWKITSVLPISRGRVKTFDLIVLCKLLATMLKGGVPILNAIGNITRETKSPELRRVLAGVGRDVRSGSSLSESLRRYPHVFSTLFTSIVEAGERVGALDEMLQRLGHYLERRERLVRKVRLATTYPAFISAFFCAAIAVVAFCIIPKFRDIYEGFNAKLPALTLLIFQISDFLARYALLVFVVFMGAGFSIFLFIKNTKKGKTIFDKFLLGLPAFGAIIKKAAVSKFCRTLSTLLSQGIPIAEALFLVGKTSGNILIEAVSNKSGKLITEGETIPAAFTKMDIFPPLMLQMTSIGVDSGALPELLDKTADFYEEEVDVFASNLTSLLEPILVVLLGAVIAVVVAALYLPIFKLGTVMGGM